MEQLNGGRFHPLANADWALIKPYLVENEKLFGIKLDDLLTHNGAKLEPKAVFRKVGAMKPVEAAKIAADDDVNLGMIDSVGKKKRKKGAA